MPKPRPKPHVSSGYRTRIPDLWISIALLIAVFAVFGQVRGFDFTNFDDPEYVTRNPHVASGLSAGNLKWALTSGYAANWFPLTWMSHMADASLFGLDPGWHHLTNVLLHAIAAMFLFAFLRRAASAVWPSALVAFVFALHPLHVESVAWVAERKDVLSAVFWFLTLWLYVRYVERPVASRYSLVAVSFALGLMAKPMIVTLPFVLLLLDIWPLRRGLRIREKIPFFAMSAVVAAITFAVQQAGGAVRELTVFPIRLRIANALVSYAWYIAKTVWPAGLAVFYPFPRAIPAWEPLVATAALAAMTILMLRERQKRPWLLVGWLWFLGTLVPVIGLVQVGVQARADRYMYVPIVGLAIMLAWSVPRVQWVGAALCVGFAAAAWAQTGNWRDSETLFQRALAVTTDNAIAEHNLAAALMQDSGRLREAIQHLEAARRLNPASPRVRSDLGSALAKAGQLPQAAEELRGALAMDPGSAIVHNNLGNVLAAQGRPEQSIAEYQAALRIDPDYQEAKQNLEIARRDLAAAHYNAGVDFAKQGRGAEAMKEFEECLRIQPDNAEAENNLGVVLSQMPGRRSEAITHFEAALKLKPDYEDARFNLEAARK